MGASDDRQERLPFDGAEEEPVPFRLTARARREVAPATLPPLTVIPGRESLGGDEDHPGRDAGPVGAVGEEADAPDGAPGDPHDPRPARARALRRSGRSLDDIAEVLAVRPELVDRWCGDVRPTTSSQPTAAGSIHDRRARTDGQATVRGWVGGGSVPELCAAAVVAGSAVVTGSSVTVTPPAPELVPVVMGALGPLIDDASRLRIRVEVAAGVAFDLAAERWAARLAVDRRQVNVAPWAAAPSPEAVRVTVRVTGPGAAGTVLGWRDGLVEAALPAS